MYITMKNVSKIFEDKTQALKNVDIHFKQNQITGLIGFNGSGKTTSYNILVKFIERFEGEILINGKTITKNDVKKISYLSAGAEPKNPMKVKRHLYQIASLFFLSKKKAKKIIASIAKELEFTKFLNSPIKSLSKGNQQKIKVIASFLNVEAKIFFLDEPFDGLDPIMVQKIKNIYMKLEDTTIIITSHRMNVVQEMCKEFYVLKDGEIIAKHKTENKVIAISANEELPIEKIKNINHVIEVLKGKNEIIIKVDEIKNFKNVNKEIISYEEYIWSSLKDRNIAEEVFRGYGI